MECGLKAITSGQLSARRLGEVKNGVFLTSQHFTLLHSEFQSSTHTSLLLCYTYFVENTEYGIQITITILHCNTKPFIVPITSQSSAHTFYFVTSHSPLPAECKKKILLHSFTLLFILSSLPGRREGSQPFAFHWLCSIIFSCCCSFVCPPMVKFPSSSPSPFSSPPRHPLT